MSFIKHHFTSVTLLFLLFVLYWQFFFLGKVPVATDLLVGAYYPWLDYSWGFLTGVPVKNPIISDVFSQFFVWKYIAVDQLKHFQLPLWNRYSFSGIPLLETYYSASFFPFNLILFIPGYLSWGLYIFGQTFFAALGMYLFIKRYIKSYSAQLICALVFSLGGLMTTWLEFGTGVWANATAPWILLFTDNFIGQQKLKYLVPLF